MPNNLIEQYNNVVNEIISYEKFLEKELLLEINPIEMITNLKDELNWLKDVIKKRNTTWLGVGFYSEKNTEDNKEKIRKRYTQEQSKNPFYDIAIDDYPFNALSVHLEKEFQHIDFSKLLKIHDQWASQSMLVKLSSSFTLVSFFFAYREKIINFIGPNIKPAVNGALSFGILSTIFLIFFVVGIVFTSNVILYSKSKRKKVRRILEYTAVRMEKLQDGSA